MCPDCDQPVPECVCRATSGASESTGSIRVRRESKGRKGKVVTLVSGVPLGSVELGDLARELKNRCGAGGTVRDGIIEIQGDHRDKIVADLQGRGWQVKRSGG